MSQSSTESSPQSNGQLLPNQKVRTTCNACQQAKIRCSHSYPCDRCVGHGFECVYSISQPLGRPAKKKSSRLTLGLQARRAEKDVVGRPTRKNTVKPSMSIPRRERQRTSRLDAGVKSSPFETRELLLRNSSTGVRCLEADPNVPSDTDDFSGILGKHVFHLMGVSTYVTSERLINLSLILQENFRPDVGPRPKIVVSPAPTRPGTKSTRKWRMKA